MFYLLLSTAQSHTGQFYAQSRKSSVVNFASSLSRTFFFFSLNIISLCKHSLVVNAVLVVDVQQFVFDPADLQGRLFASLVVQTVLLIQLSQTHHGLLTHTPLQGMKDSKSNIHAKEVFHRYLI